MEQTTLPKEWPHHIRKDMETFLRMYPDATPDMIKRHAHSMDELTPDAEKSAQTPLPPNSDEYERAHNAGFVECARIWQEDRAKTREVVQALVDALGQAHETMRWHLCENERPVDRARLMSNRDDQSEALALAKSRLQIEPTK